MLLSAGHGLPSHAQLWDPGVECQRARKKGELAVRPGSLEMRVDSSKTTTTCWAGAIALGL
jgi:hypothetical protein